MRRGKASEDATICMVFENRLAKLSYSEMTSKTLNCRLTVGLGCSHSPEFAPEYHDASEYVG
jgi:hypothetical protein